MVWGTLSMVLGRHDNITHHDTTHDMPDTGTGISLNHATANTLTLFTRPGPGSGDQRRAAEHLPENYTTNIVIQAAAHTSQDR